jgi:linoleoyl-CoA desaturase
MQAPRFTATPLFYNDLRQRINAYFETAGKKQTGNWQLFTKAIILIALHVVLYTILVFFTPPAWLAIPFCGLLGILTAGIGFNVMHDGSHGSFSKSPIMNRIAALTLNVLGGNDFMWHFKHNVLHHSFTNIDGVDDDIDIKPMMRMCDTQEYHWWHRFQAVYSVILYAVMYGFWMFYLDYKKYFTRRIGGFEIPRMSLSQHFIFWGGKIVSAIIFVIIPIIMVGLVDTLIGMGIFLLVTGLFISIVFQLAHTVEHTFFPTPSSTDNRSIENEWAIHQIETTANFATRNPAITWFCGGLNFQVEHHLFPKISHIHYPAISKIVKATCQEYGIRYNEFPLMLNAVASHWRLLHRMGQQSVSA